MLLLLPISNDFSLENFKSDTIKVEVKGQVEKQGIYYLDNYSNIDDLLNVVIVNDDADLSSINLNQVLKNNDVVVIPQKSETSKVSINTATIEQLITLPSIGEKTAEKIIEYRINNGLFQSLEDIKNVKGIGDKKFEQIKDLICL